MSIRLERCHKRRVLFRPEDSRCIKPTRRDNRSAGVLATPKIVGASKRLTEFKQAHLTDAMFPRSLHGSVR